MSTKCKNDMWTEITTICRLRRQNATSLKVEAGTKQACSQVLRFGRQNKLLGEQDLFLLRYMFETNFSVHNKI